MSVYLNFQHLNLSKLVFGFLSQNEVAFVATETVWSRKAYKSPSTSRVNYLGVLQIGGELLKGAIVFLAAFLLFLAITLGYPALPPGNQISNAIVPAEASGYLVLGLEVRVLIAAIFNGVIYGVIIWLVYSIVERMMKKEKVKTVIQPASPTPV